MAHAGPPLSNARDDSPALQTIDQIIARHERGEGFRVTNLKLDEFAAQEFVEFKVNPPRFLRRIFDGNWAYTDRHPLPGDIRIIRVITGTDGISRAIGRQAERIFATPWLE